MAPGARIGLRGGHGRAIVVEDMDLRLACLQHAGERCDQRGIELRARTLGQSQRLIGALGTSLFFLADARG
jgi:hypothetical protein